MTEEFIRKPSGIEAFFIDLDECGCNMTFHFYLKLDKQPSCEEINDALDRALETHGNMNLMYKDGKWFKSDYIPRCTVKEVEEEDPYSFKPTRINFYKHTIAINILHVTKKDEWHLCFDFHHGVVDGRSGVQFVYDFFEILNGHRPTENEFLTSDCEIIHTPEKLEENAKKIPFTVLPECEPSGWDPKRDGKAMTRVLKKDTFVKAAAAKLSAAVSECFTKKSAKMIIPVDVRRYANDDKKSFFGNLFVPVFVDTGTVRKMDEIRGEILEYVKQRPLLEKTANLIRIYSKISPGLRLEVLRFFLPIVMESKNFIYCALVSSVGMIDSEKLCTKNFKVDDVVVTFASFPFTAFSVISIQYNGNTNTTVCWHSGRVPDEKVTQLIETIEKHYEI